MRDFEKIIENQPMSLTNEIPKNVWFYYQPIYHLDTKTFFHFGWEITKIKRRTKIKNWMDKLF